MECVFRFINDDVMSAGAMLMKLFLVDLLGGNTPQVLLGFLPSFPLLHPLTSYSSVGVHQARILNNKLENSVMRSKPVVRWSVKCATVIMLVLLNLGFLYECLLYGNSKGHSWQRAWLVNVIINIAVDVLFNNVTEVVVLHYLIPSSISAEAASVASILEALVASIYVDEEQQQQEVFSAPDFFFLSVQVAKQMPSLLESVFVQSYTNPYPQTKLLQELHQARELVITNSILQQQQVQEQYRRQVPLLKAVAGWMSVGMIWLLQCMGVNSMFVQKLLLHTVQPLVIGGFTISIAVLTHNTFVALGMLLGMSSILAAVLWWAATLMRGQQKMKMSGQRRRERVEVVQVVHDLVSEAVVEVASTAAGRERKEGMPATEGGYGTGEGEEGELHMPAAIYDTKAAAASGGEGSRVDERSGMVKGDSDNMRRISRSHGHRHSHSHGHRLSVGHNRRASRGEGFNGQKEEEVEEVQVIRHDHHQEGKEDKGSDKSMDIVRHWLREADAMSCSSSGSDSSYLSDGDYPY
jgi:hypothetical protein